MKKLVLTGLALVAGATLSYAQGTITMNATTAEVYTNTGTVSGGAAGSANYTYEVLDMTQGAWAALTAQQQAGAYNLLANQSDISLWTDSGVSGVPGLGAGSIKSSTSATAQNWVAPSSNAGYFTAANYDYYTIVGWSSNLGNWATVSSELAAGTLGGTGWFGQSAAAFNYAGGGASGLGAAGLFSGSAQTQLAGSGGLPTVDAVTLVSVPEPTTLALAGLGGISMLFLRRRKS